MRSALLLLALPCGIAFAADDQRYGFVKAERLEYHEAEEASVWDVDAWYGGDYNKLWLKSEGANDDGDTVGDLQLLFSRAVAAFVDVQAGLRIEDFGFADEVSVALSLHGDAPYRFDYDVSLFLSESGDLSLQAEVERDFLITQQWVLQPRIEAVVSADDRPSFGIESGISELEAGIRLRYEINRKLAPYVGVQWERDFFSDESETTLLLGICFWLP